nr:glycosyltransferase family 4 protein [Microvirga puerhi]
MTGHDKEALDAFRPSHQATVILPPFLDLAEWEFSASQSAPARQGSRLLTVAMMRKGDKFASYRILAKALSRLMDRAWTLDIVGDGEELENVRALFAPFGKRVDFQGQIDDRRDLRALYERSSLFVWPAVNEAYGMVLLEAQLFGCPVLAGAYGGVADVVRDGTTGLLVQPGDARAFARGLATLLDAPEGLRHMGEAAHTFVRTERSLEGAASRLRETLMPLIEKAET